MQVARKQRYEALQIDKAAATHLSEFKINRLCSNDRRNIKNATDRQDSRFTISPNSSLVHALDIWKIHVLPEIVLFALWLLHMNVHRL